MLYVNLPVLCFLHRTDYGSFYLSFPNIFLSFLVSNVNKIKTNIFQMMLYALIYLHVNCSCYFMTEDVIGGIMVKDKLFIQYIMPGNHAVERSIN